MAVPRSRILDLMKVQCRVFGSIFNPEGLRLGNKILRQRLKGPSVKAYYPPRIGTIKDLRSAYPEYEIVDEEEDDRIHSLDVRRLRGKGAPKKKRTAAESKKFGKKKPASG